jgi:hypothetical protein
MDIIYWKITVTMMKRLPMTSNVLNELSLNFLSKSKRKSKKNPSCLTGNIFFSSKQYPHITILTAYEAEDADGSFGMDFEDDCDEDTSC